MKAFKFRLDPVLEQRKRIEEERQLELAARERDLQEAQDELARLDHEYRRFSMRLRDEHERLQGEELRLHYAHLQYLDRRIVAQHGVVAKCREAVDHARAALLDAAKERKAMERLKERRLEEHRADVARLEQRDLDDANNRRLTNTGGRS